MELALHCIALTSYRYGHVFENAKLIFSSLLPPPKNIYKNKLHNCNSIWMLKNISLKHTGDLKVILAPVQFKTLVFSYQPLLLTMLLFTGIYKNGESLKEN